MKQRSDLAAFKSHYVLGLLFATYAFSFIDRQILGVLVGPVKADLDITDFQFSLLQGAAFALLYSVVGLPLGRLADRASRKKIIGIGVLVWSFATAGSGIARNFTQLFAMRMLVGAGEAALAPAASSIITDLYPRDKLTTAMSIFKAGVVVGSGMALILGGRLYDYFTTFGQLRFMGIELAPWQATFMAVGAPGLVLATLIMITGEPARRGLLKVAGQDTAAEMSLGAVMRYMFKEHRTLYGCLFGGCSLLAIVSYGFSSWFTETLIRTFAMSRGDAGTLYGMTVIGSGLMGIAFAPILVGFFLRQRHIDANMRALLWLCLGLLPTAALAPQMPDYRAALVLVAGFGFFQAAYIGVAAAAVQMVTPNQLRGLATALYLFSVNMMGLAIGSSVVAGLTDFVFEDESAVRHSLTAVAACLLPLAALLFWKGLPAFAQAIKDSDQWSDSPS